VSARSDLLWPEPGVEVSQLDPPYSEHSFIRGFMLGATAILGPLAVAMFLTFISVTIEWPSLANHAMGATFVWLWLLTPYLTSPPVVSSAIGALLIAMQWVVVATAIGIATRRLRLLAASGVALGTVIGVGAGVLLMLHTLGYNPAFEGP
jgi:hypothetical protein